MFSDVAIFCLWRPENEPEVNLLVSLESSKSLLVIFQPELWIWGAATSPRWSWAYGDQGPQCSWGHADSIGTPESSVDPLVHPLICMTISYITKNQDLYTRLFFSPLFPQIATRKFSEKLSYSQNSLSYGEKLLSYREKLLSYGEKLLSYRQQLLSYFEN